MTTDDPAAGQASPLIFVSYRRVDTQRQVRPLVEALESAFGPRTVIVDTDSIRVGDEWRLKIEQGLHESTILLVLIGERWLNATDEFWKRRIDNDDDWVRTEILHGLTQQKVVIPVYVGGQAPLVRKALPQPIGDLADLQGARLREDDWDTDLAQLLNQLEPFGLRRISRGVRYPTPAIMEPRASDAEIDEFLRRHRGWEIQFRPHPEGNGTKRRGIGTRLDFRSFADAMHFMSTASWGIDMRNHHPEWENIWKSVIIWITQFDIGGDITNRNIELADYLMSVYEPYGNARSR